MSALDIILLCLVCAWCGFGLCYTCLIVSANNHYNKSGLKIIMERGLFYFLGLVLSIVIWPLLMIGNYEKKGRIFR